MGHIVRFSFDAKGKLPYYSRIEARDQEKAMAESIEGEMAAEELDRICTQLYGTPRWQTALSRELRVNDRTVRRWASGDTAIPHPVALCVRLMAFLDELSWLGEWRQLMAEES